MRVEKMRNEFNKELSIESRNRFGKIAIEMGFITIEQALIALIEQAMDNFFKKSHKFIGEILSERGWITPGQIRMVLNKLSEDEKIKKEVA